MGWLWATDCAAATFAWRSGIASGLYATVTVTILVYVGLPQDPRARGRHVEQTWRRVQWALWAASVVPFLFWLVSIYSLGWSQVACYVGNLSLGMLLTLAPFVLLYVFTAAQWVGRASAR